MPEGFPPILDACCGGRQFWFDKQNPNVLFADCRVMPDKVVGSGKDARTRRCLPDRVHDFRQMEYPDETFQLVVFDPPHLFLGANSFMAQSYGSLNRDTWREDLSKGFGECFRVLKAGGVLIFKWNECDVPLSEVLKLTPNKPLFGHPSGKAKRTHWLAFWKPDPSRGLNMKKQETKPLVDRIEQMSNADIQLLCGDLSRQEMRTARALLDWVARQMRSDQKPFGDPDDSHAGGSCT